MKITNTLTIAAAVLMLLLSACGNSYESATADLSNQNDSLSYSFGYLQGSSLAAEGIDDIDMNNYIAGLQTAFDDAEAEIEDRKSTRLNSSHVAISYAVFCLKKKITLYHLATTHVSIGLACSQWIS